MSATGRLVPPFTAPHTSFLPLAKLFVNVLVRDIIGQPKKKKKQTFKTNKLRGTVSLPVTVEADMYQTSYHSCCLYRDAINIVTCNFTNYVYKCTALATVPIGQHVVCSEVG